MYTRIILSLLVGCLSLQNHLAISKDSVIKSAINSPSGKKAAPVTNDTLTKKEIAEQSALQALVDHYTKAKNNPDFNKACYIEALWITGIKLWVDAGSRLVPDSSKTSIPGIWANISNNALNMPQEACSRLANEVEDILVKYTPDDLYPSTNGLLSAAGRLNVLAKLSSLIS
jgi:hypothetical protein